RIKKMHLDYVAGFLSIPVLLTAVIINFGNLNKNKNHTETLPTPIPQQVNIVTRSNDEISPKKQATEEPASQVCKKSIGPVNIIYPQEGQRVSDNPTCIEINYSDPTYCSVVWSYKINDGNWSEYNNNSPCLYNLSDGEVTFKLRVNSTVSSQTESITRKFEYEGKNIPTLTPTLVPSDFPTPIASPTATTNN
ncbi:MAG: hypothetical protein Q8P26_01365, partial [Candidatus Levybacteria bacterium]|nr:hypothetical protein [Candidatus Levybacteria bacterium]